MPEQISLSTLTIPMGQTHSNVLTLHSAPGAVRGLSITTPPVALILTKLVSIEVSTDGTSFFPLMDRDALVTMSIPGRVYDLPTPVAGKLRLSVPAAPPSDLAFTVAVLTEI